MAPAGLRSPLGLAWRLQRGVLLGWVVGILVMAPPMGAVGEAVDDLVAANESMADMLRQLGGGGSLVDTFFGTMLSLYAIAIAAYTVQALLRLRSEEIGGHLEPVLATAVSRPRWLASHIACAVGGSALLLALAGAGTGLGYGLVVGDPLGEAVRLIGASLAWLPATLALGGFVVAAFGLLPRWSGGLAWAALTACLLMGQIGALLELPQAVLDISPFTHVPPVPAADVPTVPLVALTLTAVALAGIGLAAFRRRDLTT
jgi:ABC-2 type transport system permease protein